MRRSALAIAAMLLTACAESTSPSSRRVRVLDDFEQVAAWQVQHTDDVGARLSQAEGRTGKALRLKFDFDHVNGYATAHRALPLDLPPNYEISFWVRGAAPGGSPSAPKAADGREEPPVNNLQFKLIDASGENVWWRNQPDFVFSHEWRQIRIKQRQIAFAWGPTSDRQLKHAAAIEFVVSSGRDGGKGMVDFDELTLRTLPEPATAHALPVASASSTLRGTAADLFSASSNSLWCSDPKAGPEQTYDIDLREEREFGGVVVDWWSKPAADYDVLLSDDAKRWRLVREVRGGDGGGDPIDLPESEARYVRIAMHHGGSDGYCLTNVTIKDLAWGATPNAFFQAQAKNAARGAYPRGFSEQVYWTVVGIDGGPMPALLSEDGALQPGSASFSIEPFLLSDGRVTSWADVAPVQSLLDGDLPIPSVEWKSGDLDLRITAFATGTRQRSQVIARYRLRNLGGRALTTDFVLALRPFQVNPPAQFLNTPGGVSLMHDLAWDGADVKVDGQVRVVPLQPPRFVASRFDAGEIPQRLTASPWPDAESVHDETGYASGALIYHVELPARGEREIALVAPLTGAAQLPGDEAAGTWTERELQAAAASWRKRLNRATLNVPDSRIPNALRTALAHILISRDGAALRPGTRSYARSWIRDGAMMADALLRLGETEAARDYVDWYAPHQFANGKVPCCVDHRGSDPVPENDSHGELIHAIAQLYRFDGDRAGLEKNWPHIEAAIAYMDQLRAGETGAANPAFAGLLPASISHEGYSAKPMHSYWDDFWALTGYKDAAAMAQVLGSPDAARIARSRDAFAADLHASIVASARAHAIDYVPGCAELGDFDATSTTVAFEPAGEQSQLPGDLLRNTFERYWREFVARRDGAKPWKDYTPYEWRTVGSFVRLGWRDRAQELIDFFFASGARPQTWNQWAEVVGRDAREPRFIGDMPHAWVASDYIRSALTLFAYQRDDDLVLAAGVPAAWLDEGITVERLPTPFGDLTYHLQRTGRRLELRIAEGIKPPGGFELPWPLAGKPGATRVNKAVAQWRDNELHIRAAPATVTIDLAGGN